MLFISWVAIYPREGTETSPVLIARSFSVRLQFIPARGRKPAVKIGLDHFCVVAIYPREGTETKISISAIASAAVAIHPREGTETQGNYGILFFVVGCNLSPRGDGNEAGAGHNAIKNKLQFIPARGRKRKIIVLGMMIAVVAIHPREGTETAPCRGRAGRAVVAIHPREGTKTCTV